MPRTTPDLDQLVASVRAGDRVQLARAITLVESGLAADQEIAQEVLDRILPHTGGAIRVGISGVPGVGKSTFIEALGTRLVARGHRVAVLAVDPSSTLSGGSILGDKSRMPDLARAPEAFIRPSPSAASLGGVARRTRESMLLCEAAGFDVVLVETVGVGQSETAVADMVDFFLVLMLPGATRVHLGPRGWLSYPAEFDRPVSSPGLSAQPPEPFGTFLGSCRCRPARRPPMPR